jgi:O-acetyl-ADP-ribose deacetylase (regulator of RNase III)
MPRRSERIEFVSSDITAESVDAIVNAANGHLRHGGGVARAIRLAAGDGPFQRHCNELIEQRGAPIPTGQAIVSESFDLPCRAVIHTVGPVYGEHDGREPELLAMAYRSAVECASQNDLKTLSFPAISCGIYGYPLESAARTGIEAVMNALEDHPEIELVRFCFVGEEEKAAFERAHREYATRGEG